MKIIIAFDQVIQDLKPLTEIFGLGLATYRKLRCGIWNNVGYWDKKLWIFLCLLAENLSNEHVCPSVENPELL